MIDKIFVIHLEKLKERREYLDSMLPSFGIPYEYIVSNERTDSELDVDRYYISEHERHYGIKNLQLPDWNLTDPEIFASIQHFKAYEMILKDDAISYALIIEDDAVLKDGGISLFNRIIDEYEEYEYDFDMCFISDCCGLHTKATRPDSFTYESDITRCNCAYIVNRCILESVISTLPFSHPIDWHLNRIKKGSSENKGEKQIDIRYHWSEPTVFRQGSENEYKSNIR